MANGPLTGKLIQQVCDYVKRGVPVDVAGEAHGIVGILDLIEEGEQPQARGFKRQLADDVRKAKAEFRAAQTMTLTKHAMGFRDQEGGHVEGDWRAAEQAMAHAATEDELEKLRRLSRG